MVNVKILLTSGKEEMVPDLQSVTFFPPERAVSVSLDDLNTVPFTSYPCTFAGKDKSVVTSPEEVSLITFEKA